MDHKDQKLIRATIESIGPAIREKDVRIKALEAENAALKTENAALKATNALSVELDGKVAWLAQEIAAHKREIMGLVEKYDPMGSARYAAPATPRQRLS